FPPGVRIPRPNLAAISRDGRSKESSAHGGATMATVSNTNKSSKLAMPAAKKGDASDLRQDGAHANKSQSNKSQPNKTDANKPQPGKPPKKGFRPLRWLVRLVVLAIVLLVAAPYIIAFTPLKNWLAKGALKINGEVHVGSMSLGLF